MKYQAFLFDLDGTLLDTLADLTASVNRTMEYLKERPWTSKDVCGFVGNGIPKLIERALPGGCDHPAYREALSFFLADYQAHMYDMTRPYEGVMELLEVLKQKQVAVGIVSNKADPAVKGLCSRFFDGLYLSAIGASEKVRKKPAPDAVWTALKEMGNIPGDRALYIGDSDVDIDTAAASGLDIASVTWGFRTWDFLKAHGARMRIDRPCDLVSLIEG